ncbi:MAG: hypothetical protein AUK47_17130 [Deltaproteobacteria bacterium CG2_30_63_29]|nr:MAG: hypothetical protein AUK47_17130 [Deltaproteobacteria bacterium CG2_30_63_29]
MAESNYQTVFHFEVLEDGVLAMRPVGALTVATMEMGFAQLAERLSKLSGPVRVCVQTGQAQIKEAGAVRFAARFLTTRSDIGKWAVADLSGPKVFHFSSVADAAGQDLLPDAWVSELGRGPRLAPGVRFEALALGLARLDCDASSGRLSSGWRQGTPTAR